jgi:hypothetical protein
MRSRLTTTPPAELRQMPRQPYLTRRRVDESRVVVHLEGEHDVDSARLARELEDVFGSGADAMIDLSDAEFIDSSTSAYSCMHTGLRKHRLACDWS